MNKEQALEYYYKYFTDKKVKKELLDDQLLYNLFKKPKQEKGKDMPHFQTNGKRHENYQADVLFLPEDPETKDKFLLVVVDVASGFTEAEPMNVLNSTSVYDAFEIIFNRGLLPYPKYQITIDGGPEFKGKNIKLFKDKQVYLRNIKPAGRSRQVAFAENRNKLIAVRLFMRQYAQEILTGKLSTEWVKDLPIVLKHLNEEFESRYKERLESEIRRSKTKEQTPIFNNPMLEVGQRVRVALDKPKDYIKENKISGSFRATDPRWEEEVRTIVNIIANDKEPLLYIVSGLPSTAYTYNRLQVVSDNEQDPPKSTLRNNLMRIKKILEMKKERRGVRKEKDEDGEG